MGQGALGLEFRGSFGVALGLEKWMDDGECASIREFQASSLEGSLYFEQGFEAGVVFENKGSPREESYELFRFQDDLLFTTTLTRPQGLRNPKT